MQASQSPQGIPLLHLGVCPRLQLGICSTMDPHVLQGCRQLHHGLHHRLLGSLCSAALLMYWPGCLQSGSSHVFSSLWMQLFFPVLTMLSQSLSLMGLTLANGVSVLEPAVVGSIRHGGSFHHLLTEAIPVATQSSPKSYHANPIQRPMIFKYSGISTS